MHCSTISQDSPPSWLRSVLYPPPHIPSESKRNTRNPSRSNQIPSGMVGIRPNSDLIPSEKQKKFKLRFLAIPSFSESFRVESELKKDVFLDHFLPYSDHIPTSFRPKSDRIPVFGVNFYLCNFF